MEQTLTATHSTWQSEMDSTGRVTVKSSFGSLFWRVGIAIALVAFFIFARYQAGDIGQRGLTIAIIGFGLLIVGLIAFVRWQYSGKEIVIDSHGIKTMEGETLPWSDITSVDVYAPAKSPPAVSVNLTQAAWDVHLSKKGAAAKAMHKANKMIVRDRALVMPSYLDADPEKLAVWLNQYAQGSTGS